jgi:hypothetical protein
VIYPPRRHGRPAGGGGRSSAFAGKAAVGRTPGSRSLVPAGADTPLLTIERGGAPWHTWHSRVVAGQTLCDEVTTSVPTCAQTSRRRIDEGRLIRHQSACGPGLVLSKPDRNAAKNAVEMGRGVLSQAHSRNPSAHDITWRGRTLAIGCRKTMRTARSSDWLFALAATLVLLPAGYCLAQQPKAPAADPASAAAAGDIANFFREVGDHIYEYCIFELSQEQLEVQQALIEAYIKQGASNSLARQLAVKQIHPPHLSDECKQIKNMSRPAPPISIARPSVVKNPKVDAMLPKTPSKASGPTIPLADKKVLPQWDCAPGVDYVTILHRGYERKLTDGEICSPFDDVVRSVPDSAKSFRLGYTITTGRLFIIADDPNISGKTIAWAISGREACRNNPDPECLATRAIGPLPPGQYSFASEKNSRVGWGPRSKRMVAGIYLTKLWYKERFTPTQTAAILARGNIAIHVRLKGEMSEACLGLGPNGWAYVSSLIKDERASGVDVFIDEPYPHIAESPPVVKASSFSLSSLFK